MPFPNRVTRPFLWVLAIFIQASEEGNRALHGWAIKKSSGLSGAATYKMLDRLEDAGWVTGHWEERNPEPGKPPRRLYRLTAVGETSARALLAERHPGALRDTTAPGHLAPDPRFGFLDAFTRRLPGGAG